MNGYADRQTDKHIQHAHVQTHNVSTHTSLVFLVILAPKDTRTLSGESAERAVDDYNV